MTKKKNLIVLALISLATIICLLFGVLSIKMASAQEFVYSGELKSSYNIGDEILIPIATVGDVTAESVVSYPDGNTTSKKSFFAEKSGLYTVNYFANVNGKTLKSQKSFSVNGTMFSIEGTGNISYVEPREDRAGIAATIAKDSALVYNDIIDLSSLAWDKPFVKLAALPKNPGEAEADMLRITLIDVYDENLYVDINVKRYMASDSNQYSTSYIDASFNGGTSMGLYKNTEGTGKYDVYLTQYENNPAKYPMNHGAFIDSVQYGYTTGFSMTGGTAAKPQNAEHYRSFSYDYQRNQVLTTFYPSGVKYDTEPVADFSFREVFGGEAFAGFTDGKVKMKIAPVNMQKDTFTVFISEVAGKNISEAEAFSYNPIQKPLISLDLMGYNEKEVPQAIVGKPYPVFEATGLDFTKGSVDVSAKVFYGYSNLHKARVDIQNGMFTPNRVGTYTIEYSTTSSIGETTTKLINVQAINKTEELALELQNERNYDEIAKLGEEIKLFDDYVIKNCIGRDTLTISATLKSRQDIVYHISEESQYAFLPYYAGEYEIVYEYGDFIETKQYKAVVVVEPENIVYYETVKALPNVFIKNGIYDVDVIKAFSCESGQPVEVDVEIYVINDDNSTQTLIDGKLTVTANEKVKLVYKPVVSFVAEAKEIVREVVDVGLTTDVLQMQKYFKATKGEVNFTATQNGINSEVVTMENGVVEFDFINALQRQSFQMTLTPLVNVGEEFVPFNSLNIYLKNFEDESQYVKFSFYKEDGKWMFGANDGASAILAPTWGSEADELYISYYPNLGSLSVNGGKVKLNVPNFYGSKTAVDFDTAINLTLEIAGTENCSGIVIQNINEQKLSSSKRELGSPIWDKSRGFTLGEIKYGATITVLPMMCYDVLSPTVNATLKIITPRGAIVEDITGKRLTEVDAKHSYQFKLTEYGSYRVVVQVSDISINENTKSYDQSIEVVNNISPEITLINPTTKASVGKAFALADFTVDNKAQDEYKSYYVIRTAESVRELVKDGKLYTPDGNVTEIGKKYTPKTKGIYYITVMVVDKDGNMGEETYTVEVK